MVRQDPMLPAPPRAFNVPGVALSLLGVLIGIHILRQILSEDADLTILLYLIFSPSRYISEWPGGWASATWSFVTHALLHGDFVHLAINGFWFLAFGSAVARRFGPLRFLLFSAFCAAAGAALFLALHWGERTMLVGASGAISGYIAGAARFMFQESPFSGLRPSPPTPPPALTLVELIREPQALAFIGIWFVLNLLTGLVGFGFEQQIAWEAHLGGFIGGLLAFALFDRR